MGDPGRLSQALSDRYRIEREIGAGGMATVYLAQDLRHQRRVAVKVLRPDLSALLGGDRFLNEIRVTANLQHPHILPLFDSGEVEGLLFYVMPFVEGEPLSERIAREKQLPVEEAVRIAREVAGALDYAHRRGVIHRDIKPANILLQDGTALVADFGIALAVSNAGGARLTETGLSLGTPAYMSPEQATGDRKLDARSDVYSLGAVLYEMLTGDPPHTGSTAQAVIAAVVTEQPRDVSSRRARVAPHVAEAVHQALEKLPADRFATAADFARALEGHAAAAGRVPSVRSSLSARTRWLLTASGAALLAIGLAAGRFLLVPAPTRETRTRLTFTGDASLPATSDDGRWLSYVRGRCWGISASGGCSGDIVVQELPTGMPVVLVAGARGIGQPVWNPDGSALLVTMTPPGGEQGLYVVPRAGGVPRKVADAAVTYDFTDAGTAAYVPRRGPVIRMVDLTTGDVKDSVVVGEGWSLVAIDFSPRNGKFFFSGAHGSALRSGIADGRGRVLDTLPQMAGGGWDLDGRHAIIGVFDARSLLHFLRVPVSGSGRFAGKPVEFIGGVRQDEWTGLAGMPSGYVSGESGRTADVWAFGMGGTAHRLTHSSTWYQNPILSPDGRTVAYIKQDAWGANVYSAPVAGGAEHPVTTDSGLRQNVLWLPDGKRLSTLVFARGSGDEEFVHEVVEIGTGRRRQFPLAPGLILVDWRPDFTAYAVDLGGRAFAIVDSTGRTLRRYTVPDSLDLAAHGSDDPTGREVALATRNVSSQRIVAMDLETGALRALGPAGSSDSTRSVVVLRWASDGFVYFSRQAGSGPVELWRLPGRGGLPQRVAALPVPCDWFTLSLSADARTGACLVSDERPDLWLVEGRR